MKRLLVLLLAFALAGCGAVAPTSSAPAVTDTPVVQTVVVTVLVTQLVTQEAPNTATPTLTPIATFTPEAATAQATATTGTAANETPTAGGATTIAPTVAAPSAAGAATATLPADAGGGVFTNMTRSTDHIALKCQPDTVTFTLSTTNPAVYQVDLFYRIEDQLSSSVSGWVDVGKMTASGGGGFTKDFAASLVYPDLRTHKAWLDYQFVGISRTGDVVGRSAKIVKQISFGIDCTD